MRACEICLVEEDHPAPVRLICSRRNHVFATQQNWPKMLRRNKKYDNIFSFVSRRNVLTVFCCVMACFEVIRQICSLPFVLLLLCRCSVKGATSPAPSTRTANLWTHAGLSVSLSTRTANLWTHAGLSVSLSTEMPKLWTNGV